MRTLSHSLHLMASCSSIKPFCSLMPYNFWRRPCNQHPSLGIRSQRPLAIHESHLPMESNAAQTLTQDGEVLQIPLTTSLVLTLVATRMILSVTMTVRAIWAKSMDTGNEATAICMPSMALTASEERHINPSSQRYTTPFSLAVPLGEAIGSIYVSNGRCWWR